MSDRDPVTAKQEVPTLLQPPFPCPSGLQASSSPSAHPAPRTSHVPYLAQVASPCLISRHPVSPACLGDGGEKWAWTPEGAPGKERVVEERGGVREEQAVSEDEPQPSAQGCCLPRTPSHSLMPLNAHHMLGTRLGPGILQRLRSPQGADGVGRETGSNQEKISV